MEQQLGNATLTTIVHQPGSLWKSPRGEMLRIEASALVAIILTFLTAIFGSWRRWSNHWFIQKGFLAINVLSLSLGTYSIGLMQSSSVKSEMYPIWSVSLFTLFGCVDSVTSYNGLDYMSPLLKIIFQLCLYCGYVLLMSISIISTDVGNIAVGMLSAITFIKGFHRALALVLQSRTRNMAEQTIDFGEPFVFSHVKDYYIMARQRIIVDFPPEIDDISYDLDDTRWSNAVTMADIELICNEKDELRSLYDVCAAFSLSHKLQRHILGLSDLVTKAGTGLHQDFEIDYMQALKVIDVELAFLYETFFTGNTFLHYYHARSASVCSLASLIGICFVGVAVVVPGTMTSRGTTFPVSGTTIVDTTAADLFITLIILVSLAMLQLMQLIWCWTSNWARVAFACEYARRYRKRNMEIEAEENRRVVVEDVEQQACPSFSRFVPVSITTRNQKGIRQPIWSWWVSLKWFVISRTNWLDKHLWQDKLGQCSLFPEVIKSSTERSCSLFPEVVKSSTKRCCMLFSSNSSITSRGGHLQQKLARLLLMRGLRSIRLVARDLLGSDTKKKDAIRLDNDIKASITKFLHKIRTDKIEGYWLSSLSENGVDFIELPFHVQREEIGSKFSFCFIYALCIMIWHVATCYCELAEQEREKQEATSSQQVKKLKEEDRIEREKNRRVAIALSRYCVYLVASAPELLPEPAADAKRVYVMFGMQVRKAVGDGDVHRVLKATPLLPDERKTEFWSGVDIGKKLMGEMPPNRGVRRCSDPWKALALVWVQILVFGAPYGKREAHMRHLSRGGEFITHIWALLYHLGVRKWQPIGKSDYQRYNNRRMHEGESPEEDEGRQTQDREEINADEGRQTQDQEEINAEQILSLIANLFRLHHAGIHEEEPPRVHEE